MNLRAKLLFCIGAALGALSLGTSPLVAIADPAGLSDTVKFYGTTVTLTCDPPNTDNDGPLPDTCTAGGGNGVPVTGGSGIYRFTSSSPGGGVPGCTLNSDVNDGDSNPLISEIGLSCSIDSSGTYESISCGNGEVSGTAGLLTTDANGARADESTATGTTGISFNIDFVSGIGRFDPEAPPLEVADPSSPNGDDSPGPGTEKPNSVTETDSGPASIDPGGSLVVLTSGTPGDGVHICVTSFSVKEGTLAINDN